MKRGRRIENITPLSMPDISSSHPRINLSHSIAAVAALA